MRPKNDILFGGNSLRSGRIDPLKNAILVGFTLATLAFSPNTLRAQDVDRLVHEGVVKAPVDKVWAAFTTKEGLESWMAAHANIELKLGGRLRTQYDPKGSIEDPKSIENTIISYEPVRMLSIKVSRAPDGFPFPNAIKNMWTVLYFMPEGDTATRVRVVSMGFGNDDESMKMRDFFNRGNAITLERLQKRFAPTTETK